MAAPFLPFMTCLNQRDDVQRRKERHCQRRKQDQRPQIHLGRPEGKTRDDGDEEVPDSQRGERIQPLAVETAAHE